MSPTSTFWIGLFSWLALFGAGVVIIGIVLESAEVLVKFKHELKCRKWVVLVFGKKWRRELVLGGKFVKSNLFWPFEVLGFAILIAGLVMEMIGSFSAERLQSRENAILESTNVLLSAQVAELVHSNLLLAANERETIDFAARIRMKLIAPRSMYFDSKKFIADLSGKPKGTVSIFVTSGNKLDSVLAVKIRAAITNAGWVLMPPISLSDEFLANHPECSMGNVLVLNKFPDFKTDWYEHPKCNPDGSIDMTNLWRMDTPERAFKAALADCGIWVSPMMENTNFPNGYMQLFIGIEQW